jgi:predicted N-acyltransferase
MEGQALAWVPMDFDSTEQYLARLSPGRRRDIRRKLRSRHLLDIQMLPTGSAVFNEPATIDAFHVLYQQVYAQSEVHFDFLSRDFFDAVLRDGASGGVVFVYRAAGRMIGWNLCFEYDGMLVDKYIGLDYPASREFNLYVVSWMENLDYARRRGLRCYVAGWTDPGIKVQLGAKLTFTRHAVRPRNALLRALLRRLFRYFESDQAWMKEHRADATRHP